MGSTGLRAFKRMGLGQRVVAVFASAMLSFAGRSSAVAQDREPRADRVPRDHTYSLGLSVVGSRFRTEGGLRMGMAGPGVTVNYTVGRQIGFGLRANVSFPMHGRLDDGSDAHGVNLIDLYDSQRLSFDTTYYVYYRLRPTEMLEVVFGGGVHVHTMRLLSAQYDPIELIQGGFAGLARVEHRLSDHLFLSGELAVAVDPLDFVKHVDRATLVAPMALTFALGARR